MPPGAQCGKWAPCHGVCRVRERKESLPEQMCVDEVMKYCGQGSGLHPEEVGPRDLLPAHSVVLASFFRSPKLSRLPSPWLGHVQKNVKAS